MSTNKKKEKKYSANQLKAALLSLDQNGTNLTTVSQQYGIPRSTLWSKFHGKRPKQIRRRGPPPMLGTETEAKFVTWIQDVSNKGFPLTKDAVKFTFKKLLNEGHGKPARSYNKENGPGRKWFASLLERHPNLVLRKAEYLHRGRAAISEERIRKWFDDVTNDLGDNITILEDPQRIFNCDETAFFLYPKSPPVLATKGQRNVYDSSTQCNKSNVTVLITGNACGDLAPPMALFSFERIPTAIISHADFRWGLGRTPNGWMTAELFFEYVVNVLNPYFNQAVKKPVILFLDGHASHLSLQLAEFCSANEIILIALPPNATHILQPLDVAFFFPLKKLWTSALDKFRRTKNIEPQKHHVIPIVDELLRKENFKNDSRSGFKACGLFPFNADNVNYGKCISTVSNLNREENNESNDETATSALLARIPPKIRNEFEKNDLNAPWNGHVKLTALYLLYKSVKFDLNFEDLMEKELAKSPKASAQKEIIPSTTNTNGLSYYELDDSFMFSRDDEIIPSTIGSENTYEFETNDSPTISTNREIILDVNVPVINATDLPASTCYSELNENNLHFEDHTPEGSYCSTFVTPVHSPVAHLPETSTPLTSYKSIEMDDGWTSPLNLTIQNSHQTSISSTNTSDRKVPKVNSSLEEILNSVVTYKNSDNTTTCRRKRLQLPPVMTSKKWLNFINFQR